MPSYVMVRAMRVLWFKSRRTYTFWFAFIRTHVFVHTLSCPNGCLNQQHRFSDLKAHWIRIHINTRIHTYIPIYIDYVRASRRLFYCTGDRNAPHSQWPASNNNSHEITSAREPTCVCMETRRRRRSQRTWWS